jgi:MFS family permease
VAGHGRRFWLLAGTGALIAVFSAPASQLANEFLRDERGFSGARVALFTVVTVTPASLGIVVGGRLADVRGRRGVGAITLAAGTVLAVVFYFARGWPMWAVALLGTAIADASLPALGVYGPELFPTSLRGRANGVITVAALAGSALGLWGAGALADGFGRLGPAMAVTALGPLAVAVLVVVAYPETAGQELEDLNPEDRQRPPPPPPPPNPPPRNVVWTNTLSRVTPASCAARCSASSGD